MLSFEFNGKSSEEYNLIVTTIEENDSLESRSLQLGEKNKYRPRENHFGAIYDNNYTFTVSVIKNPCRSNILPKLTDEGTLIYEATLPSLNNGVLTFPRGYYADVTSGNMYVRDIDYFTSSDIRKISAWLTSPQYPRLFKFIGSDYFQEEIEYFATITSIETENVGFPCELKFTVTCDAPFGYSPETIYQGVSRIVISDSGAIGMEPYDVVINNNSDCYEDYIYPVIKLEITDDSTINITNQTDNGSISFDAKQGDHICIDSKMLKVYNYVTNKAIPLSQLGITDVANIYWPRLCYGENNIFITGNANVTISYREYRKAGVFA
mgnify:FL=1